MSVLLHALREGLMWMRPFKVDGVMIGAHGVVPRADQAYHIPMYIAPKHRRKGFGKRMQRSAIRYCHNRGRDAVQFISPENLAMLHVSKDSGMIEEGEDEILGQRYIRLRSKACH